MAAALIEYSTTVAPYIDIQLDHRSIVELAHDLAAIDEQLQR